MEELVLNAASDGEAAFAVGSVKLSRPISAGEYMDASKELLAIFTGTFPPSWDSYTVSPTGDRLALMTGTGLELYLVSNRP